jgi:phage terminase large subunit-like protein
VASRKPRQWWGSGPAPHLEWPGVTIEIPAVWSAPARRWQSPDGRFYFDRAAADAAVEFFPTFLRHSIGGFAGAPFTLLPYQARLLTRPLFGWKRASDGLRRFSKVTLFAPKGAGKSPWGSGTGLYLAFFDHEPAAEVVALARDREQARVVHNDARLFVETSPDLLSASEVLRDAIFVPSTGSTFKVLAADAGGRHGWRPHAVILDEIQEQRTRDLLEAAVKSLPKRRQPVLILMGHAGTDQESVGFEEYAYAKGVIDGTLHDDAILPVVFEASDADDWQAEDTWKKVNPGYGTTVQAAGIRQAAHEAANEPRKRNDFLRFHLNRWTNQAVAWLPIEWWDACRVPTLDAARLATFDCAAGLDMAQSIDYASFVVGVRVPVGTATVIDVPDETGAPVPYSLDFTLALVPFYWLPEDRLHEREREDGLPLSLYRSRGQVFTTPGATLSTEQIWRDITQTIAPRFPRLRTIGYDPAFAFDLAQRLRASHTPIEFPQNYNFFTAPCYAFEGLIKAGRVQHDGHPLLRWNVSNVAVKRDEAGRIRPVKPKVIGQARKRIDGVVAALMALGVLQREAPAAEPEYTFFVLGGR